MYRFLIIPRISSSYVSRTRSCFRALNTGGDGPRKYRRTVFFDIFNRLAIPLIDTPLLRITFTCCHLYTLNIPLPLLPCPLYRGRRLYAIRGSILFYDLQKPEGVIT